MAYKQNPGRGPMMKTGRDIPLNMKSPAYMTDGPGDKKNTKKDTTKIGEIPSYEQVKEKFKGRYEVFPKKGKKNEYKLMDKSGHAVTYKPGKRVKDNSITAKEAIQMELNKKNK